MNANGGIGAPSIRKVLQKTGMQETIPEALLMRVTSAYPSNHFQIPSILLAMIYIFV